MVLKIPVSYPILVKYVMIHHDTSFGGHFSGGKEVGNRYHHIIIDIMCSFVFDCSYLRFIVLFTTYCSVSDFFICIFESVMRF